MRKLRFKAAAGYIKRAWQAYLEATRHKCDFDDRGFCSDCGKIIGDW